MTGEGPGVKKEKTAFAVFSFFCRGPGYFGR